MNDRYENAMFASLKGLVIGTLIGGALGVLFAPQSGEKTRKVLKKKAESTIKDMQVDLEDAAADVQSRASTFVDKAKDTAEELKGRFEDRVNEVKEDVANRVEDVRDRMERDVRPEVEEKVDDAKKKVKGALK